ncbi:MAG: sugar phosphate isomerase/epimerase family protein, partial [Flavitalea sp.]
MKQFPVVQIRFFVLMILFVITIVGCSSPTKSSQSAIEGSSKMQSGDFMNSVGMVSYTYRNSFARNFEATLDTIKSLGITNIEFSNLFGKKPEQIRSMIDQRGMRCTSYGVSYNDALNKTDEVAASAKTLGATYVRVAWIPFEGKFDLSTADKAIRDFNETGKRLKEKGLTFCYHNHGYEFQPYDGGTYFDYMMKNTDPQYVSYELDVLWAVHPGADPVVLLNKYGNRFKLMHVKDQKKGVQGNFSGSTPVENDVALGTGQVNWNGLFEAAVKAGVQY